MGINIGKRAYDCLGELRGNAAFEQLLTELSALAQKFMLDSFEGPVDQRVEQTAYARALYHLWVAYEAAYYGRTFAQVKPPALKPRKESVDA
jgi:hypothetical protein